MFESIYATCLIKQKEINTLRSVTESLTSTMFYSQCPGFGTDHWALQCYTVVNLDYAVNL